MRFEFLVRSGKDVGRTITVSTGHTITLGRLKDCDVVLDDEAASRRHCTIAARDTLCAITDMQSANGTFVNEKRTATAECRLGDKIRVGSTVIELVDASNAGSGVRSSTTSLRIVETPGGTIVQRAVDPTKLEFLHAGHRHHQADLLQSAQKYLATLHSVSEILARASSVESLFDSIVQAVLEVSGGDRAAVLMRPRDGSGDDVNLVAVRTKEGQVSGAVTLSRTVINDVLERGVSVFTNDALADERYGRAKRFSGCSTLTARRRASSTRQSSSCLPRSATRPASPCIAPA